MTIVQGIGERNRETQADAADEILRLIAIEHDGVQHTQRVAARVEIESQRERQPAAFAIRVFAFELDDGARGPALLDGDFLERAFENLLPDICGRRMRRRGPGAAARACPSRSASRAAARDGFDDVRAAARQAANELARVDFDAGASVFDD